MAIRILFADRDLNVIGDPLDGWTSLDVTTRFNEPASGTVHAPAYPEVMSCLAPGNRVIVVRDGEVWCQGPMEVPTDYVWGIGDEGSPDPGTVEINFSDDLAIVAGYITWLEPTGEDWESQPITKDAAEPDGAWRWSGQTSGAIIRSLVRENCGDAAFTDRRIPNFSVTAASALVGETTSIATRYEALLDACRRVADEGGGIGFRTRVEGGQILFECYEPADRTRIARFSKGLGNLRSVRFRQSAPTATHALVATSYLEPRKADAGPPVVTARDEMRTHAQYRDTVAAAAWWRSEKYVDSSAEVDDVDGNPTTAGLAEMYSSAREALEEGAATVELSTTTVDTPDLRAGRDYGLGDLVAVDLPTGVSVTDIVRSIHLQATPTSGEYVTALVGSSAATRDSATTRAVRELARRLGRLETR